MIVGVGVDMVETERIRELAERYGGRFLERVFTRNERDYCMRRHDASIHLAARFAAKEAFMKAIGTGWGGGVRWKDVEVQREGDGPPRMVLHGEAAALARSRGASRWLVSISHSGGWACAVVVLEGRDA